MKGRMTTAASRRLAAGEVHASGPASQEVVPALAHVGPIAKATSAPKSSGVLLAPSSSSCCWRVKLRFQEGKGNVWGWHGSKHGCQVSWSNGMIL